MPWRWDPQTHYGKRLAGIQFLTNFIERWGTIVVAVDGLHVLPLILTILLPSPTLCLSALFSESRWNVEELLLRHSFLPQRGVHPLLWRLRHQAVCSRWTTLFRPARQLRRIVELASSSPSLPHYILVQIFRLPVPPARSLFKFISIIVFGIPLDHWIVTLFCSTCGLRSMIFFPHRITAFNIVVVCICVPHHTILSPPLIHLHLPPQLFITSFSFLYIKMYKQWTLNTVFKSCEVCH